MRSWGMRIGLAMFVSALTMVATSGCASVMSSGPREVPIASQPPGAKVSIYNRSGVLVTMQTAPFVAYLSPRHKYFRGQRYRVVFEMEGYETAEVNLKSRVGPWYLGNLLLGGPVGFLIIDPATGAMYRLEPDEVDQTLTPLPASTPAPEPVTSAGS